MKTPFMNLEMSGWLPMAVLLLGTVNMEMALRAVLIVVEDSPLSCKVTKSKTFFKGRS